MSIKALKFLFHLLNFSHGEKPPCFSSSGCGILSPEADFWWGRGDPAPLDLPVSPCRLESGVQAFISPSLVVPGAVDAFHIGLLSVPVSYHRDYFLSWGFPLDNYSISYTYTYIKMALSPNVYVYICVVLYVYVFALV